MEDAILRTLTDEGPQTLEQLVVRFSSPPAVIRHHVAHLVFVRRAITCSRDGRYSVGDPTPLLTLQ